MKLLFLSLLFMLLQSCCNNENRTVLVSNTVNDSLKKESIIFSKINVEVNGHQWKYEWNHFISSEIEKNKNIFINNDSLYKNDIYKLCPNYYNLKEKEKITFWTLLIASISKYESNFDTNCRFREGESLNYVYSEGLLQLSYGDELRYDIPLNTQEKNILIPEINLKSGVIILAKQLKVKKTIFTTKSYYWSVLTKKQNEIIIFFKKNIKELNICE